MTRRREDLKYCFLAIAFTIVSMCAGTTLAG